ncbi:gas vesicle protein GvpG [Actinocatenispora comari]|jgi:hypothetical protein|uniref:Gas vesicle protein n=1 Tax=Actinocatenispora comari TaxID=2807577 RepID=A0A8J4AA71_9ACTN|nr:gas vesicle protein GvpG [Actinocatenispora comari]GIL27836.1 gas vesicle protein [Actinocatenispora comari]
MGLLTGLLTLPLAPVRGVAWVADQIDQAARREYYDPAAIRAELARLADAVDRGEISEAEFDAAEDELLDRLEAGGTDDSVRRSR